MIHKFVKGRVTKRIFFITTALLVVSTLLIYLLLYFLLPTYYYKYKQDGLSKNALIFAEQIKGKSLVEATDMLEHYSSKNRDVTVIVRDSEGRIIYTPSILIPSTGITKSIKTTPMLPTVPAKEKKELINEENPELPSSFTVEKEVQLREGSYQFTFYTLLYPIDEVSHVLTLFTPYIMAIIIIISIIGALVYSNIIAKPLINLNTIAKRMAKLDFSQKSKIESKDELGELSNNLNNLSENLQQTMIQLKSANEKLKDDIQKERELDIRRRQFLAAISHDLKTPITVVKGQLEGMLYNIGVYKDRDHYLQKSLETMNSMEALVKEILELSKLESEGQQLSKKNINLSAMIEEIIRDLEYFRFSKQLDVLMSIEEDIYCFADIHLLKKAIHNIIHNAYSYTKEGKKVYISLNRRNGMSVLEILNVGAYIDGEHLDHIFEPFYRIEKSRNRNSGGHGLGLFIVQQLLDAHKLQYSLQNTEDGVLFIIYF